MPELTLRQRLAAVLFPALLGPLQLLMFGPHTLYARNLAEFSSPFWSLVPHWLPGLMLISGSLVTLGVLLPTRVFRAYVTALFAVGLLLWVQGNLIVADYGLLDGQPIDFSQQDWRAPYEIGLWFVLPVLTIAAAGWMMPVAVTGSRFLVLLQVLVLGASTWQVSDSVPSWEGPADPVFELSTGRNVFHIVLDGFQSDAFLQIAQEDEEEFAQSWAGFEFFVDHAGAFRTTIVSIPAMLTGAVYRNEEPIDDFVQKQLEKGFIFSILREYGYDVDFLSGLGTGHQYATNAYLIPRPFTPYHDYTRFTAWQLIDLSLFRHAPHAIKPWIYNDQAWRLQTWYGQGQFSDTAVGRYLPVNGQMFFEEFTRRMTVSRERPVYKFLHVGIPHQPVALDENCVFVGPRPITREGFTGQARCAVRIVMRFLDRLRELGVYDDSLIVVSSYHGAALPPMNMRSEFTPGGDLGMSRALLKLSGGSVHDYATISDDAPSPRRASRARRAATSVGISLRPFTRRNPFAASSTPAATQRSTIVPPRQRFTFRFRWRVRLSRLSMAFVVASERWRRSDSPKPSTVSVSSRPSRTLAAALG